MNPTAIYSKSGKGVQEATGKTSLLKRADRAVLSAIDGRATVSEVAQKVGKPFDAAFQALITQLDREGFVREVSAGAGASGPVGFGRSPAAKPAGGGGAGEDLDFTGILTTSALNSAARQPKPADDAAKRAKEQEQALYRARQEAEARAQEQRDRTRAEAEAKARAEAEAKFRAEAEKRLREEAQAKLKAEAEAKAKAAREAALRLAAEAKAKAEAEAHARIEAERKAREEAERRAREEAERARREAEAAAQAKIEAERKAREEAERKAREEAEQARREAEELRHRLEEERKAREAEEKRRREEEERRRKEEEERRAREEAERKAREEAERKAREEAERKAREEAERKAREEAERKAREEAERRAREEAERQAAEEKRRREEEERRRREEEERARKEAERKSREEQEARARREREEAERREREEKERKAQEEKERKAQEEKERKAREEAEQARRKEEEQQARAQAARSEAADEEARREEAKPQEAKPQEAKPAGGGLDALLDDIESFSQREEEEARRKKAEAAERKARQEAERKAREAEEQRRREEEERRRHEEQEAQARREREEAERKAREEEEERERERKAAEAEAAALAAAAAATQAEDDIGVTDEDLDMDEVRKDEAAISKESRKARRQREREARQREKEARERERAWKRSQEAPARAYKPVRARRPRKWGRAAALTLFVLLAAGIGALHVMPVPVEDYERAASQALGRPVNIDAGRLSLLKGVALELTGVTIGDEVKIARVRAHPQIGSLFEETKAFSRIELEGVTLPQAALGEPLFDAKARGPNFSVERVVVRDLKLTGAMPLPPLAADLRLRVDGTLQEANLSGPENLRAKLVPQGERVSFEVTASSFTLPFATDLSLGSFAMKGVASRRGMSIESWGGTVLDGALSGTANVRWGSGWQVDGVMTARGINAAVFAPALLSRGKADGTAKFSMSGADPGKLAGSSRIEGSFSVEKGVLGSFDLSRAIQTDGRQANGRTEFSELSGQATYDRGAVALRNVSIGAGALTAGASADIAQGGALSGRIVADIKTASQALRTTLILGGTVKDPQVRN